MNKHNKKISMVFLSAALLFFSGRGILQAAASDGGKSLKVLTEVFVEAVRLVREHYVSDVSPRDLVYGAIRGMLLTLDGHSEFLTPEELERLQIETEGVLVGIGAKVMFAENSMVVVDVLSGSPASAEGIGVGDRILEVNGEKVSLLDRRSALEKLKGRPEERVRLLIERSSSGEIFEKILVRARIDIPSVEASHTLAPRIGYVKIVEFGERTRRDVKRAIEDLREKGAEKLILDVRDNPGGTLESAIAVTRLFLDKSRHIVTIEGRGKHDDRKISSRSTGPFSGMPLAILINEASASASEVVAGSLKDNGRAVIVGQRSFGKGSVQILLRLRDGSGIRITTAEYFTPSNRRISGLGIEPDAVVEGTSEQIAEAVTHLGA